MTNRVGPDSIRWLFTKARFLHAMQGWSGGVKVRVNSQCRGVLLNWMKVGQGPNALAVGAGGVVWTFFISSIISLLSPSSWEAAQYRLKYCLKGPLTLNNLPTNLHAMPAVLFTERQTRTRQQKSLKSLSVN